MSLKAGQIAVLGTDFTRSSLAAALLLGSGWTHVVLALGDGTVLSTYPGSNARIRSEAEAIAHRDYVVLDLPLGDAERARVVAAAKSLVGEDYWLAPCSVITAQAFRKAGIDLYGDAHRSWRTACDLLVPHDYFTMTRASEAASHTEDIAA